MPNWCMNTVTIEHKDAAQIEKVAEAFKKKELFATFAPVPDDSDARDIWGCKWDGDGEIFGSWEDEEGWKPSDTDLYYIKLDFQTPWAPPIGFYETMEEQGFNIEAYYAESGCCFVGEYSNGSDDYYEYEDDDYTGIPKYLLEYAGLDEEYEEWDDEDENKTGSD